MIIDCDDNLELPDADADRYYNLLDLLQNLAIGLDFLNCQVSKVENEVRRNLCTKKYRVMSYGNDPRLEGVPRQLIYCAFKWYSVTVCDYVRTIGWLGYGGDNKKAMGYLNRVIPHVKNWRDKVGAHLALTDPRENDSPADLQITSSTWQIGFRDDAFTAGELTMSLGSKDGGSTSRQDRMWKLTDTHQQLASRYGWHSTHEA